MHTALLLAVHPSPKERGARNQASQINPSSSFVEELLSGVPHPTFSRRLLSERKSPYKSQVQSSFNSKWLHFRRLHRRLTLLTHRSLPNCADTTQVSRLGITEQ
jgi:hypothetical protein